MAHLRVCRELGVAMVIGTTGFTDAQKAEIAEIRKFYQAKIAEAKILLAGDENLPREVSRMEQEMEEKIQRIRGQKAP